MWLKQSIVVALLFSINNSTQALSCIGMEWKSRYGAQLLSDSTPQVLSQLILVIL